MSRFVELIPVYRVFKNNKYSLILILLALCTHPVVGQDWQLVNSGLAPYNFYDVEVINEEKIFIVGSNGSFLTSHNGGDLFMETDLETNHNLYDIYFLDSLLGWISGGGNTLLKTNDGGLTWEKLNIAGMATNEDLISVFFNGDGSGWILSLYNLYKTADGVTWQKIEAPSAMNMAVVEDRIFLATSLSLWSYDIVTGDYEIMARAMPEGPAIEKGALFVLDRLIWYAQSYRTGVWGDIKISVVYYSSDGGDTWGKLGTTSGWIIDLYFADEFTGICILHNGQIITTSDGGLNWEYGDYWIPIPPGAWYTKSAYRINNKFIVGEGAVLRKVEHTNQWEPILEYETDNSSFLYHSSFLDSLTGWMGESRIVKTEDGGDTWNQLNHNLPDLTIWDIEAITRDKLFLTQESGLYFSEDAGVNWTEQLEFNANIQFPHRIFFLDSLNGWVTGEDKIARTTDGGLIWEFFHRPGYDEGHWTPSLESIFFLNENVGYLGVGTSILKTENGGKSWSNKYTLPDSRIEDVHFANDSIGWAIDFAKAVLYSEDGGETWTETTTFPYQYGPRGKIFIHKNMIWLLSGLECYFSNNFGANWSETSTVNGQIFGNYGWGIGNYDLDMYKWCDECTYSRKEYFIPSGGTVDHDPISPTSLAEKSNELHLYPNPAENTITIKNLRHPSDLIITDNLGRICLKQVLPLVECTVDISHLPSGIYIAILRNREEMILKRKFVICH